MKTDACANHVFRYGGHNSLTIIVISAFEINLKKFSGCIPRGLLIFYILYIFIIISVPRLQAFTASLLAATRHKNREVRHQMSYLSKEYVYALFNLTLSCLFQEIFIGHA